MTKIMKDYTLKPLILALALLALIPIQGVAATQENTVVAKGDGIEVNMAFVKKMEQYYLEKFHQHAEKPELIRSAVEHWLFVTEALQHGLDQKMSEEVPPDPGQMTAQTVHILHKLYVAHLLDQKHVPDQVLHTYYKVFPEKFTRQSSPADNQDQKNNESSNQKGRSVRGDTRRRDLRQPGEHHTVYEFPAKPQGRRAWTWCRIW